jgi:hypothetical protein
MSQVQAVVFFQEALLGKADKAKLCGSVSRRVFPLNLAFSLLQ